MAEVYEGMLQGKGFRFGIVISRFNEVITARLLNGAKDCLFRHAVNEQDVDIAWVPGCLEIPLLAKKMAQKGKYNAIICLGAVIRGGTPHFEYVSAEVNKGIARVSLDEGIPVIQGIITADTLEQAIERAGAKEGNRGFAAAQSAIEMVSVIKSLEKAAK